MSSACRRGANSGNRLRRAKPRWLRLRERAGSTRHQRIAVVHGNHANSTRSEIDRHAGGFAQREAEDDADEKAPPDTRGGLDEVNGREAQLLKHQLRQLHSLLREGKRVLHNQERMLRSLVSQAGSDTVVQQLLDGIIV